MTFLFENDVVLIKCNNMGTAVAANDRLPASGSFIDMAGIDHAVFIINIGGEDTASNFQVYQDTSATETADIKVVTGAVVTIADTDDNKWATVEFNGNQIDRAGGFRYVTLVASAGAGGNDYYCIDFLGFHVKEAPVTKSANYLYHVSVVS